MDLKPGNPDSRRIRSCRTDPALGGADVIIMGGGVVGLSGAYPDASAAVVGQDSGRRAAPSIGHKWGVDGGSQHHTAQQAFGLQDYLIQNHSPKHGLFYHWPRDANRSSDDMNDYYSIWG